MIKIHKIFVFAAIAGFLFFLIPVKDVLAGQCKAVVNFQAQPNPVAQNGTLNLTGYVDMSGSVWEPPGTPNAGYCIAGTTVVKAIAVQFSSTGGFQGLLAPNKIINLEPSRTMAYGFLATFKPSDQNLGAGKSFIAAAKVFSSDFNQQLTISTPITVNVAASVFGTYACVADNGRYACSPTNNSSCSDVPNNACQGKKCFPLTDTSKCGQPGQEPTTHKACSGGACVDVAGAGSDTCITNANCVGGGGTTTQTFNLPNPIGVENFQDLINIIGKWIFNLAIPIAVIIIIYAGVLMLTAGGNPANFQKGAKALWYAVLGLAVVLIGKGFVTLIQSILSLRK